MKISQQTKKQVLTKPPIKHQQKKGVWTQVIKAITRPPRISYQKYHLSYSLASLAGQKYERKDQIVLHEGKQIQLSIYDPETKKYKIILYLHGNSSSRLEAKNLIKYLPEGYSLAGFDFMGCGNNTEADTITLGHNQSKQVQTVTNYLRGKHYTVILWGRSMGAVSALKYGKADVIVADSPFRDIRKLFKQMSIKQKRVPSCLITCLFPCVFWKIRRDVLEEACYDLNSLNIQKQIKKISPATTLIFLTGNKDTLIDQYNSQKLYKIFAGKSKHIQIVQGDHNDKRPPCALLKIMQIIRQKTQKHEIIQKQQNTDEKIGAKCNSDPCTQNFNMEDGDNLAIETQNINLEIRYMQFGDKQNN